MKNKEVQRLPKKANEGDMAIVENKARNECIIFIWYNHGWEEQQRYKGTKSQLKKVFNYYEN